MSQRPKPYHHGSLHEALLDAGDKLLQAEGLKGFTLRACARKAGVSHAAPAHHFGSVQGFLTALAIRGFERLTLALQQELASANDLDEEFHATARAYIGFATEFPEHFRIMFRCDLLDMESSELKSAASGTYTELSNVIRRQRGEREVTVTGLDDKITIPGMIQDIVVGWTYIHGLAHLKLEQQLDMVPGAMLDSILEQVSHRLARMIRTEASGKSADSG